MTTAAVRALIPHLDDVFVHWSSSTTSTSTSIPPQLLKEFLPHHTHMARVQPRADIPGGMSH